MTDHNREEREALIEKAAKAILNEMGGIVPDELEQMHENAARAALAVFEQAQDLGRLGVRAGRGLGFVVESGPMTSTGSHGATFIGYNSPRAEEVSVHRSAPNDRAEQ